MKFHAVMLDETRCEFGVLFEADSRASALEYLVECYPESQCVQLETPQEARKREDEMYRRIQMELDYDRDFQ